MGHAIMTAWRALARDRRGSAIIEFAAVLPVLVTLYMGGYALSDAIACNRKVTIATRVITDLTTRYTAVSTSDLQIILAASTQVLSPYSATNAGARVTEINVVDATHGKVVWSQAQNSTALTVGSLVTIPSGTGTIGTWLIVGEIDYTYQPPVAYWRQMHFADRIMMSPRLSDQVILQ